MGFVKRMGTTSVKQLLTDFYEIKKKYVEKVSNVVTKFQIPDSLIINWDQTGCQLIPGGDWTMDQRGAQQVSITGLDDKRQVTLLLAINKSGSLLSPQLIYMRESLIGACQRALIFHRHGIYHTQNLIGVTKKLWLDSSKTLSLHMSMESASPCRSQNVIKRP